MDYDVVVIGSGVGGGTAAAECASAGLRVLVVERGGPAPDATAGRDEARMLIRREGWDDAPLELDERPLRPLVGSMVGGSSALYGAALLRPSRSDFEPGRLYGDRLPPSLHAWPVSYDALAPYYERAEDLYAVSGDASSLAPHLCRRLRPYPHPAPPLEPLCERIERALRSDGLAPFRLPLAIDFARCQRCGSCPGLVCPTQARASAWTHALAPALAAGGVDLWTRCEAERIDFAGRRASSLRVRFRDGGRIEHVGARAFLLGAGALGTAKLLLRSRVRDPSEQLGRNHMCHLGAVSVALYARPTGAAERFAKQLGITDYYHGDATFPHKLGYVQGVPIPGPLSVQQHSPLPMPRALARAVHRRALVFTGSIEDLPRPTNRVSLSADGRLRLERSFDPYDRARARWLAQRMRRHLARTGAVATFASVADGPHGHFAHQVGTCRFGSDPAASVLDAQCRLHGYEGIYVVDGSVFPTSLGVGPALTIAANALRVAGHVAKEVV